MSRRFQANNKQQLFIATLQAALRSDDPTHIRVCGEPGIGKTRLILESTRPDDLAPLVLYCHAASLLSSPILQALSEGERFHATLVVEECDADTHARLVDQLAKHSNRISVVSIYQDVDHAPGINLLVAPVLDESVIIDIIASYGAPKEVAQRWAPLCDGSPRVAHVIGENLRSSPEDISRRHSCMT